MCVAIYKPAGVKTPSLKTLKKCWDSNPDGAGFSMRIDDKKYTSHIKKGFMKWAAFKKAFEAANLADFEPELFIHFRIATHGGVSAGNTHPFPISANVSLLQCPNVISNYTLMHNGILPITPDNVKISDTMAFCARLASGNIYLQPEAAFNLLEGLLGTNKLAIMAPEKVYLYGQWEELDGVYFSNLNWDYTPSEKWAWGANTKLFGRESRSPDTIDEFPPVFDVSLAGDIRDIKDGICPDCACNLTSNGENHYCKFCDAVWRLR